MHDNLGLELIEMIQCLDTRNAMTPRKADGSDWFAGHESVTPSARWAKALVMCFQRFYVHIYRCCIVLQATPILWLNVHSIRSRAGRMAVVLGDTDFDLSCSENSVDFSPESTDASSSARETACLAEYRVFSSVEARTELQWLLGREEKQISQSPSTQFTAPSDGTRLLLVDALCNVSPWGR